MNKAPIYTEFDYIELGNEFLTQAAIRDELKNLLGETDKNLEVYNDDFVAKLSADLTLEELDSQLKAFSKMTIIEAPARYKLSRILGEMYKPLEKRSVLGLGLLHLDGLKTKAGGQVIKNVAGYDLRKLYLGSFNSLALIRSAYIRLEKIPMLKLRLSYDYESLSELDFLNWRSLLDFDVNQTESKLHITKDFAYEASLPFTLNMDFYGMPDLLELRKARILEKTALDLNVLISPFKKKYPDPNQFSVSFHVPFSQLQSFSLELSLILTNLVKSAAIQGYAEASKNSVSSSDNAPETLSENAETEVPLYSPDWPRGVLKMDIDLINSLVKLAAKPDDFKLISEFTPFKELNLKYQPVIRLRPLSYDNRIIERLLNLSISKDDLDLLKLIKAKFDPEARLNPGMLF